MSNFLVVRAATGERTVHIYYTPDVDDSLQEIKWKIAEVTHIPEDDITLVFGQCQVLDNSGLRVTPARDAPRHSLKNFGIAGNAMLTLRSDKLHMWAAADAARTADSGASNQKKNDGGNRNGDDDDAAAPV